MSVSTEFKRNLGKTTFFHKNQILYEKMNNLGNASDTDLHEINHSN